MFFDKKARVVEEMMFKLFDQIEIVLEEMRNMLHDYLHNNKKFKQESFQVHRLEHKADKLRRKIGQMLSSGAFLPIYREDYFRLIESVDNIANQAEHLCDYVTLTRPEIPEFAEAAIVEMIQLTVENYIPLKEMLLNFISGKREISELAKSVRLMESKIDELQFHATRDIFKSSIEKLDKFHLKSFIDQICIISNLIEDVSDQVEIIAAKHKL